jgi:hypothetical protein
MFLTVAVLWQGIKINCLLSQLITTNTALKPYLSIIINLKSITKCCHKCLRTKKGYNILGVRSLKILAY